MINIYESSTAEIIEYGLNKTIPNPYFVFKFVDTFGSVQINTVPNTTDSSKYDLFEILDGSTFTFSESGSYYLYESPYSANYIDSSMNLLSTNIYTYIPSAYSYWHEYDPSISIIWHEYNPN